MAIKKCPHCGSNVFMAKVVRAAKVESLEDGTYKIIQETSKYDIEVVKCSDCKVDITEEDLLVLSPCSKCGTLTTPALLDKKGECDVCKALDTRPDLANASKEDIIRMLLKLESNNATVTDKIDKKIEKAQEISTVAQSKMDAAKQAIESVANGAPVETEETTAPETVIEDKSKKTTTRKKRVSKKSTSVTEDAVEEKDSSDDNDSSTVDKTSTEESNSLAPEEIQQAASNIANSQEAPFPEQEAVLKDMFSQSAPEATSNATLPQGGFPLFDQEEQSF